MRSVTGRGWGRSLWKYEKDGEHAKAGVRISEARRVAFWPSRHGGLACGPAVILFLERGRYAVVEKSHGLNLGENTSPALSGGGGRAFEAGGGLRRRTMFRGRHE